MLKVLAKLEAFARSWEGPLDSVALVRANRNRDD
jgi:hypothetical protein